MTSVLKSSSEEAIPKIKFVFKQANASGEPEFNGSPHKKMKINNQEAASAHTTQFVNSKKRVQGNFWEPCVYGEHSTTIPASLSQFPDLSAICNMETWNSLTEDERTSLQAYLPQSDADTTTKTLERMFSGENFYFGNPLEQFNRQLQAGQFHPQIAEEKKRLIFMQQKDYVHNIRLYHNKMVQKTLDYRKSKGLDDTKMVTDRECRRSEAVKAAVTPLNNLSEDTAGTDEDSSSDSELRYKNARGSRRARGRDEDGAYRNGDGEGSRSNGILYTPAFLLLSVIRDCLLSSPNMTADFQQILRKASEYPVMVNHIPPLYKLPEFVSLALVYLRKPPTLAPDKDGRPTFDDPLIQYDPESRTCRWLVPANDETKRGGPDHLQALEQLFFFATARNLVHPDNSIDLSIMYNRQQRCVMTVEATIPSIVQDHRAQEIERYNAPEKCYVYKFNGYKCIVAPMKRGANNSGIKAREHFLLKTDRPPHINLLCLIRDAASRLPGGVGTRPDVAMLLRDSQWVVESVTDDKINTVVSGALDRLHSEQDPCVRFDADQKLWTYLHRHRTEADFKGYKIAKRPGSRKALL